MERRALIFPNKQELSREVARLFSLVAQTAVVENGRFLTALSGGSTPQTLFALLAAEPYAGQLPWEEMHFFWGDERLVPPDDPGSNYFQAQKSLFNQVAIPEENIHRVKGELPPEAAIADYHRQLQDQAGPGRQWPRFDLVFLGLGSDGHTASLFPGSPAQELPGTAVKAVTADYQDRPAHRITLTPLVFNDARHIIFLVSGADKARALAAVLNGPQDPIQWPAQRIQPHAGTLTWMVDEAAAAAIQ